MSTRASSAILLVTVILGVGCGNRSRQHTGDVYDSIPRYTSLEANEDRLKIAEHTSHEKIYRIDKTKTEIEITLDSNVSHKEQLSEIQADLKLIAEYLSKYDRLYYIDGYLISPQFEEILFLRKLHKKLNQMQSSVAILVEEDHKKIVHAMPAAHANEELKRVSRAMLKNMETVLASNYLKFGSRENGEVVWIHVAENSKIDIDLRKKQIIQLMKYIPAAKLHLEKYGEAPEDAQFEAADKFLKEKLALAIRTHDRIEAGKPF